MNIITGGQIRMARGFLRWSVRELAEASGISINTIKRVEEADGIPVSATAGTLSAIYDAILATGHIRFEGDHCVCIVVDPQA